MAAVRYFNSKREVVIGDFPWYEMVWRSLRGDFRPTAAPQGGYEDFARRWSVPVDLPRIARRPRDPAVTWLGHVTQLLQVAGRNLLFDPTMARCAGPYGRLGVARCVPAPLAPEDLPRIDAVFVSHNHYDHLCSATLGRLRAAGQRPQYFVPEGLGAWFRARGLQPVTELAWWQQADVAPDLRVCATPAQHWSRRTPWDTNTTHWCGYAVEWRRDGAAPWRYLFPGDTGYSGDFRAVRSRLGPVDFLALPIGAYLPRDFMKAMHVNPDDAVRMIEDLEARQCMAVHWGTFPLTQEPLDQPPRDLARALQERGLDPDRVWLLRHGETRDIPLP